MSEYPSNDVWLESKSGKALETHQSLSKAIHYADSISEKNADLIQSLVQITSTIGVPAVASALSLAMDVIENENGETRYGTEKIRA